LGVGNERFHNAFHGEFLVDTLVVLEETFDLILERKTDVTPCRLHVRHIGSRQDRHGVAVRIEAAQSVSDFAFAGIVDHCSV